MSRLCPHGLHECVFWKWVKDGGIAVNPDGIVVILDRVEVVLVRPRTLHGLRVVEDVAKAKHQAACSPPLQEFQCWRQFTGDTERQVVHDQQVRVEYLHRTANHPSSQGDQFPVGDIEEETGVVATVGVPTEGWQRYAVHAGRHEERPGLPGFGNQHDVWLERGMAQGLCDRSVTPNVAEADHTLRVQGDARYPGGTGGSRGIRGMTRYGLQ